MAAHPHSSGAVPAVLRVRRLGVCDYAPVWDDMRAFTQQRDQNTADQIWLLQHRPVFTLGMNGRREHLLAPGAIPVVDVDRGGQVTYHAPGQLLAYVLLDLGRLGIGVRGLVNALEQSVIQWLQSHGVHASARADAPGVYVDGAKLAALGLRVKRGCSYHGLALNVDMDLRPFARINPCGHEGMQVTQVRELGIDLTVDEVARQWLPHFARQLGYSLV